MSAKSLEAPPCPLEEDAASELDALLRAPASSASAARAAQGAAPGAAPSATSDATSDAGAAPTGVPVVTADVDGKRVRIVAQDEIVLECGSASITLRRNGRVIVRGTYVETYAEGTNRIKGGQVRIN